MGVVTKEENEENGSIHTILASLDSSPIFGNLTADWELLAEMLNVPANIIQHWRFHIVVNELTPQQILEEILLNWKLRCGKKANLVSFIKVLEDSCKWLHICAELENHMETVQKSANVKNTSWMDLPKCLKGDLLSKEIKFLGAKKSMLQVAKCISGNALSAILEENLYGETLDKLIHDERFELATNGIPDPNPYYIKRRLSSASGEIIDEDQIIDNQFETHEYRAICIADIPGMGKSTLMARLAESIQPKYTDRIVIFLKMQHLIEETIKFENAGYKKIIKHAIVDLLTDANLGKKILLEIFSNPAYRIDLFLDGCDEIAFEGRKTVKSILKRILRNYPNVRIVFASSTGPHVMYEEIKNRFKTAIYSIQPFSEAEKVQFLVNYWNCKFLFSKNENLEECAEGALHLWIKNQRNEEAVKFGTPLQLRLLATVVADKVKTFCLGQGTTSEIFEVTTYFQIYRKFMQRLSENNGGKSIKAKHTRLAVLTVYPRMPQSLLAFGTRNTAPIDLAITNKLQLLNPYTLEKDEPEFVHRTFSEYLFAEYFVDIMVKTSKDGISENIADLHNLMKFILQIVSGLDKNSVSFQQNSLCYFLDGLVQSNYGNPDSREAREHLFLNLTATGEDIIPKMGDILQSCINHQYYNLFCFIIETCLSGNTSQAVSFIKNLDVNHDEWVKILSAACPMGLLKHISKIYESIKRASDWKRTTNNKLSMIDSHFTPLHAAAAEGNSQLFRYFYAELGIEVMSQKPNLLLHAIVADSYFNSGKVITEKIDIIRFLLENNKPSILLNEKNRMTPQPLLMQCIHFQLLEFLIIEGADVFSKTPAAKNNLAHNVAEYMAPDEYHYFVKYMLRLNAGRVFGWRNVHNDTALQVALRKIKVKSETLELLVNTKEINTIGRYGYKDSLLYHLIKNGYSQKWLALVIQATPEWPQIAYKDSYESSPTILHVAVQSQNVEAVRFLLSLSSDPNSVDGEGRSPLHVACNSFAKHCDKLAQIVSLLLENQANVKSLDSSNRQPLSYLFDQF